MNGDASCAGKKKFTTYWQAYRNAQGLNFFRDKAKANVYKCSVCRLWHVGNSLKGNRRGNRKQIAVSDSEAFEE